MNCMGHASTGEVQCRDSVTCSDQVSPLLHNPTLVLFFMKASKSSCFGFSFVNIRCIECSGCGVPQSPSGNWRRGSSQRE